MEKKPGQYIYIYDSDTHQIIVIDGETGERIDKKDDQVTSILHFLSEKGYSTKLRKFAIWCAHQTNKEIKPIQNKLFELAEKAVQGEADNDSLRNLYEDTEGTAIATDTVGLQHGAIDAPAYLASRECVNPDPLEAAIQAARFHRIWTELKANDEKEENSEYLKEIQVDTREDTIKLAEQKQINYLLDLINEENITLKPNM